MYSQVQVAIELGRVSSCLARANSIHTSRCIWVTSACYSYRALNLDHLDHPLFLNPCLTMPPPARLLLKFEDAIRKQREHIGNWMKYSTWEESQMEFERARSVYERALEVDYRNQVGTVCIHVW